MLLGAAALFEGRWWNAQQELSAVITKHFPTPPRPQEIHCTDVRRGKHEFSRLPRAQRPQLLADACAAVTSMLDTELRLFTVIIDKGYWFARNPGKTGNELYEDAFEQLVSRFDLYLRRRHAEGQPSKGIMIVDPCSTALTAALKAALRRFQAAGTRWANVYNVVETVVFLESHESPGLQMADVCSYATWRLVEFGDSSLATQIASAFDREPLTGLKNPGKWHGVKYFGNDAVVQARIRATWP